MEIFVIFLVLSFGFGALAGGERKSKYCISFFIHLIHVVCVCVVCGGGGGYFETQNSILKCSIWKHIRVEFLLYTIQFILGIVFKIVVFYYF